MPAEKALLVFPHILVAFKVDGYRAPHNDWAERIGPQKCGERKKSTHYKKTRPVWNWFNDV